MENNLIAYKYDTDKSQLYLNNYMRYFEPLSNQDVILLELGVYRGGSLKMWRDFFRNGNIVGLDLDYVAIDDPERRIRFYQGSQQDVNILNQIGSECAPEGFDIIIDDASHIAKFTEVCFWHLFDNYLKLGGIYVIEDWRVGYWEAWPDGAKYEQPNSAEAFSCYNSNDPKRNNSIFPSHNYGMVGLIKQLMDELGMDAITNPARGGASPQRFPRFRRMEICPGQVFIVKADEEDFGCVPPV